MLAALKTVIDPAAWFATGGAIIVVAGPAIAIAPSDPFFEWTGIPMRVLLGGLLGGLIGQSFLPAATLWRGVFAVSGGVGLAVVAEAHLTAALTAHFSWWPRLPFAHAAFLGLVAPTLVPVVVQGIPRLWARVTGSKQEGAP